MSVSEAVAVPRPTPEPEPRLPISIKTIVAHVAAHYGVTEAGLLSGNTHEAAGARHVAMYLALCLTGLDRAGVGHAIGGFGPRTVSYAVLKVERRRHRQPGETALLNGLAAGIAGRAVLLALPETGRGGHIPTLGFPSRTAAIAALRARDLSTDAIARTIGIAPGTVKALEAKARRRAGLHQISVPLDVVNRLSPLAAARGVTAAALAATILQTAVDEDLVDAVLDDGDTGEDA